MPGGAASGRAAAGEDAGPEQAEPAEQQRQREDHARGEAGLGGIRQRGLLVRPLGPRDAAAALAGRGGRAAVARKAPGVRFTRGRALRSITS